MRKILFLAICVLFFFLQGKTQFFVINDPDGYVNVRTKPGTYAPLLLKLKNNEIVYQDEFEEKRRDNWIHIMLYVPQFKNKKKENEDEVPGVMKNMMLKYGYVYKDRLLEVEYLPAFNNKMIDDNNVSFYKDSIKIVIQKGPFEKNKHKLTKMPETDDLYTKIDGRDFIGTDGDMPRDEIKSFFITIGNNKIQMPPSVYKDLYEPNFDGTSVHLGKNRNFYILMYNSDAAGSYVVLFIFRQDRYQKRIVFYRIA